MYLRCSGEYVCTLLDLPVDGHLFTFF